MNILRSKIITIGLVKMVEVKEGQMEKPILNWGLKNIIVWEFKIHLKNHPLS